MDQNNDKKLKYNSNGNAKFNISYHIIWIPKYRKHILCGIIEDRLKAILAEKLNSMNIHLFVIECIPDHVHLFIKAEPSLSISYIVKILKGYTSRIIRKEFNDISSNKKHLWAAGYFCETVGNITQETIIKYINNQKIDSVSH